MRLPDGRARPASRCRGRLEREEPLPTPGKGEAPRPLYLLLVEDNPADAEIVREAALELRNGPLDIVHVERLAAALDALGAERFDAVLLDLGLPDTVGLEGVERLRSAYPSLPIVVLTGLEDDETGLRALELGAQDYLAKGNATGALLLRAVRYAIERQKRARRELELQHEQQSSRRLRALQRVADAALSTLDLDGLLQALLLRTREALESDSATLLLLSEDGQWLQPRASSGLEEEVAGGVRIRVGEGFSGRIAALDRPLAFDDVASSPAVSPWLRARLRSVAGVPLRVGSRMTGVLHVGSFQPRHYSPDDLKLLELASDRASVAIEARRAEQALRTSEAQFRQLADAIPQLAWSTDAAGRPNYFNRAWSEWTGTAVGDADLQALWRVVVHPEDQPRALGRWLHSVRTGEPMECESRLRSAADGCFRWFLHRALPVRDERGRVTRWFGTSTDIDEQKRAEGELREANARLAEADQRKNEFLAVLSHELRNPLAPIRNSLYVLERAPAGGEQAGRARQIIARQVTHMARLIDDLLELTRIARGKVRLQTERLDLCSLLRRTAEDHRSVFVRSGVELVVALDGTRLWVDGDVTRLSQVVGNLLVNAAKFTPRGGRATLALEREGSSAVVRVHDTGAGIAPETLARLFHPFVQADVTLDRSRGGLGLGLSLVRGLVELHGGTVRAHSDGLGLGAEFRIALPLAPIQEGAGDPPAARGRPSAALARRVLVIEDNPDAASSLQEALELQGHEVETAFTGADGLAKARAFRPQVVLCDIGLPEMNGYQVARALRADPSLASLTLVALSGYALPEDLEQAREAGFDRHVAKPPDLDALEKTLAEAAQEREQASAAAF